jgi:hypothetical protein
MDMCTKNIQKFPKITRGVKGKHDSLPTKSYLHLFVGTTSSAFMEAFMNFRLKKTVKL